MENVYDRMTEVLGKRFGIDPGEIKPDTTLDDLDLDSLTAVEFADVLKEVIGVPVDDSQLIHSTLREIADALSEQLSQAE
jgi:acyl carrier protein